MKNIQIEELLKNIVESERVVRRIYIFRNSEKPKTINMQKNLLKRYYAWKVVLERTSVGLA